MSVCQSVVDTVPMVFMGVPLLVLGIGLSICAVVQAWKMIE